MGGNGTKGVRTGKEEKRRQEKTREERREEERREEKRREEERRGALCFHDVSASHMQVRCNVSVTFIPTVSFLFSLQP